MTEEKLDTVIGRITMSEDEHRRCFHCVRFRASKQNPGQGFCTRPLFDPAGQYTGRANEPVSENHYCDDFLSRIGGQQQ